MAQKCECCGYKFKKGDGPICPECFTSREGTVNCDDLPFDLHAHNDNVSFSDSGMSDVQKQLEQERLEAAKEKIERNASTFTAGNTATGNRSTTFGSSLGSANKGATFGTTAKSGSTTTYTTNKNGTTTTTYTTTYSSSNANPHTVYRTSYNSQNSNQNTSKVVKIIIIFITVSIILSVASTVIFAIVGMNAAKEKPDTYYDNYNVSTFTVDIPEVSMPDIPEIDFPDIPVITPPEVPEIPYFPQFGTGTNYYTDIAIISQGEKIVTDQYEIEIGKPSYVAIEPVSFATDYADYIDWDTPGDLITVEVPLTIKNNSGERLNICDFEAYLDCLFIDGEGNIEDERFGYPLPTDIYLNSVIEDGVTYTFALHYAVPVAHYYSVALEIEYLDKPDYMFYMDYTAEQVIKE